MSHPLTLFVTVCVTRLCSYQVKHSVMTLAWPRGRRPLPVLPALIGQRRHSADPGLVTRPCHWPHSASCPALGPASTASHSQQPQQPPGAGRASLHSLTEATLGKYFFQKINPLYFLHVMYRKCSMTRISLWQLQCSFTENNNTKHMCL